MNVYSSIEDGVRECFGSSVTVTNKYYIGGGDINEARCFQLSSGEKIFVKLNKILNKEFFEAEVIGINAIADTNSIEVPKLLFRGEDRTTGKAFLAMEYINGTDKIHDFWEVFGRSLAYMHMADTSTFVSNEGGLFQFGFSSDNFIGATRQINTYKKSWIDFFRECRLEPQFKMAEQYFDSSAVKCIVRLLDNLPKYLIEPKRPSLLHGDLWSGNYIVGNDGMAWLIDPAVYVGHAEADLAMTELFGRFPDQFYQSYAEINPIEPGYSDRRDLYNLYHMINHLNLFGETYLQSVLGTVYHYENVVKGTRYRYKSVT